MNNNKICFITAVNNNDKYDECLYYISKLQIPEGYEIQTVKITNVTSLCRAYNTAMAESDAKYKVYLHQDVFIRNKRFIIEVLDIFLNKDIGLIGVAGSTRMPQNGICFASFDTGIVDEREPGASFYMRPRSNTGGREVVAIDGLITVTQYDVKWREDLFTGFHYYDIAQSFEFKKYGYKVFVPFQDKPWVIHNCNFANLIDYEKQSHILVDEYKDYLTGENIGVPSENYEELSTICKQLLYHINIMISEKKWADIANIIDRYRKINFNDSSLEIVGVISEICIKEEKIYGGTFFGAEIYDLDSAMTYYQKVQYGLIRIELHYPESENFFILEQIKSRKITIEALLVFLVRAVSERLELFYELKKIFSRYNMNEYIKQLNQAEDIISNENISTYIIDG